MTKTKKLTIYIASKTKHAKLWRDLRDSKAMNINSTWIDEAEAGESDDVADLAKRCIDEVKAADRLILYCHPGEMMKGALVEIGAALASNVPVYVVGTCDNIAMVFQQHPLWHEAKSLAEASEF